MVITNPHSMAFFKTFEDAVDYLEWYVMGIRYDDDGPHFRCMKETYTETNGDSFFMGGAPYSIEEDDEYGGLNAHTIWIYNCSDFMPEQDSVSVLTECPGYYNYTMDLIGNDGMEGLTFLKYFNNQEEGHKYVDSAIEKYKKDLALFNIRYPEPSYTDELRYKPEYPFPTTHFSWKEKCAPGDYEGRYIAVITYNLGKVYVNNPTCF